MTQGSLGLLPRKKTDLIEELLCSQEEQPHTHLAPRKIAKQTGISRSSVEIILKKKETLNSSSTWKHHLSEGTRNRRETDMAPLEQVLKVTFVWPKNDFYKMKKILTLNVLSFCRTIAYMVKERNEISPMKMYLVRQTRCP